MTIIYARRPHQQHFERAQIEVRHRSLALTIQKKDFNFIALCVTKDGMVYERRNSSLIGSDLILLYLLPSSIANLQFGRDGESE